MSGTTDPAALHRIIAPTGGESHRRRVEALDRIAEQVTFERYSPGDRFDSYVVVVGGVRIALTKSQVFPFVLGVEAVSGGPLGDIEPVSPE